MNFSRIIFIGGGDLCRELASLIDQTNSRLNKSNLFYLDSKIRDFKNKDLEPEYLGRIEDFSPKLGDKIFLTISDPTSKKKIIKENPNFIEFIQTFIHPTAIISKSASIGRGCILFPFVYLSESSIVESYVNLNSYVGIGHDSKIGKYSTISAQVDIAGYCELNECCFLGSGSRIIPKKKVGEYASVGAGSVVIKNVPPKTHVFGSPAKKIY